MFPVQLSIVWIIKFPKFEDHGQEVLGPQSSDSRAEDIISHFFDAARAHGATALTADENARFNSRNALRVALEGRGYRLGDSVQPSEALEPTTAASNVASLL
ncbi:unnamed protein product [Gongylonema pulchrum]|uniref:Integrase catalytic domain-containing protein n=1 Tax=Gongylonema pulchrum TaxID=637853 RepID=A0A183EB93_9BILA|nr:unnamed protein product [Gongylonema pulchrum]